MMQYIPDPEAALRTPLFIHSLSHSVMILTHLSIKLKIMLTMVSLINRPGVDGAVLQTPSKFTDRLILSLKIFKTPSLPNSMSTTLAFQAGRAENLSLMDSIERKN